MAFLDLAKERYSVRKYENRPVEKDKIMQVLEAARYAPSAVNKQPVRFTVVTDPGKIEELIEAYDRAWSRKAPAVIVAIGDHEESYKRKDGKDHCDIDVAIAVDHLILAAAEIGLGTCWVCAFDKGIVSKALDLPENQEPIVMIPIGYPDHSARPEKKRKSMDEIVTFID